MPGNSFGQLFKITTFGESHGAGIGVVIDGCPAGLEIDLKFIQSELDRRRPGQSEVTTPRNESDQVQVLSGIQNGMSLGSPICLFIQNKDQKPKDYSHLEKTFRPSHADFTYSQKYGLRDVKGGGRSSARETAARVAAGAIAKQLLQPAGLDIKAYVSQVGNIIVSESYDQLDLSQIEQNVVRCPDPEVAQLMESHILDIQKKGDTIGGQVTCVVKQSMIGIGDPVFDRLEADLAKAMMSINASKGFEIGSGFSSISMNGSVHNDLFKEEDGKIVTATNYSGGVQGGISNGMDIYFNVAFKPVSTIMIDQKSIDEAGNEVRIAGKGRHDPCVVPRAVPIVEAMTALVLADHFLRNQTSKV